MSAWYGLASLIPAVSIFSKLMYRLFPPSFLPSDIDSINETSLDIYRSVKRQILYDFTDNNNNVSIVCLDIYYH